MFPFIIMFLVTSVTTLRERSSGTLERLLAMPMGKLDFLVRLRARLRPGRRRPVRARGRRQRRPARPRRRRARSGCSTVVAVADAVLGTALGLFVSAFAPTEFQAVQFMPAVVIPQILLCGLFVPRERAARRARGDQQRAAAVVRRRRDAELTRSADPAVWGDLAVVAGFAVAALGPRRRHAAAAYRLRPASVGAMTTRTPQWPSRRPVRARGRPGRVAHPVARHGKGGIDFATDADLASERAGARRAARAAARRRRDGEEHGSDGPRARTWLVDPICGTLNYAAGTPLWVVNVALREGDRGPGRGGRRPGRRARCSSPTATAPGATAAPSVPLAPGSGNRLVGGRRPPS